MNPTECRVERDFKTTKPKTRRVLVRDLKANDVLHYEGDVIKVIEVIPTAWEEVTIRTAFGKRILYGYQPVEVERAVEPYPVGTLVQKGTFAPGATLILERWAGGLWVNVRTDQVESGVTDEAIRNDKSENRYKVLTEGKNE